MGGIFGSKNNKSTSTFTPNPAVGKAFTGLIGQAQDTANTPASQRVAGFTPDQLAAFQSIRDSYNTSQPYFADAANLARSGSGSAANGIAAYMNPYENDVVNTTLADINHQNALDQNNLKGNAISRGAWGGDRGYLAQAQLSADQGRTTDSTLANLRSSGWNTALQASQADLLRQLQGAGTLGGLGAAAQTSALQGAGALGGSGDQQQAQIQKGLDVPFTNESWLASILGQAGDALGGTQSQTTPGPSLFSQLIGLGTSAAGAGAFDKIGAAAAAAKRGGGIGAYAEGGDVDDGLADTPDDEDVAMAGLPMSGAQPAPVSRQGLGATLAPASDGNLFGLDDKHMALLQAGLGILASNSPHPLQAIGEGASQGIASYTKAKQAEAMGAYRQRMASTAEEKARAMADYYNKKSGTVGDESGVFKDGPTAVIWHRSGDGHLELTDTHIPTSEWERTKMEAKRLGIDAGRATEDARHHRAIETKGGAGDTTAPSGPWAKFQ